MKNGTTQIEKAPPPFVEDEEVLYLPPHANGDTSHPDVEPGTVSRVQENENGSYSVFVRYSTGDTAALTPIKNLRKRTFAL